RGRKPVMLYVRTRDRLVIAVDIRSSRTFVMLTDLAANALTLDSFETPASPEELIEELTERAETLRRTHSTVGEIEGIGVAFSGMVDSEGTLLYAPQLGWRDVRIREALRES